ncbi:MAG: hypothetical protein ACTSRI_13500 [Promethearchaeota archaeon]
MKKKQGQIFIFLILSVNLISSCFSIKVYAQSAYSLKIYDDNVFIWEITELKTHNFEKVFGFQPVYEKGDQIRKIIRNIMDGATGWTVITEDWDYGTNWEEKGEIKYNSVSKNPNEYNDNIFIPTPVEDYLEEALNSLPSSYSVQGATITKRTSNYKMVKEYDYRGVLVSEAYYDNDNILMIKVEGTFRIIPIGNYFIGFIVMAITSLIIVTIKKRIIKVV